jgi:hypothetical protein
MVEWNPDGNRFLERFGNHDFFHEIADIMFVHCAVTGTGSTITGLPFPDGTIVRVVGDGDDEADVACSGGEVTVTFTATKLVAGLPYEVIIEPNNPAAGSRQGSVRGKKQKINRVTLAFYETLGCQVGMDQNNLETIAELAAGTQSGVPHFESGVLFSGDITMDFDGDWKDRATICIVQDNGKPLTLKCIIPVLNVEEPK